MADLKPFKPALIIVDFQEDFCPPNGSLAVSNGRSIADHINKLLTLPFSLTVATRDFHPQTHVSFAPNHPSSPQPFTSTTTITHPTDSSHHPALDITLWPPHCVQGTPGAEIVPELDVRKVMRIIDKGLDERVEMYSAFYDPWKVCDSGLKDMLERGGVTDVFVVGLAADYCVKATAEHAYEEGYRTYIVEECTKPVMLDTWDNCRKGLVAKGIKMVSIDGDEVAQVRTLAS